MAQDAPSGLDPACVDDVYEATIVNQIFDGLLSYDTHLNTVPSIASSWVISQDGRIYTFQLKRDIRFHDGTPLTSEDVAYSLTRVFKLHEEQSSLAREYLCRILGSLDYAAGKTDHIAGIEALDPYVVRITLDRPYASFLAVLASEMSHIVPKHYVQKVGDAEFARHPIGSGPFRLASWNATGIVLTAFQDYKPARARLDSLVYELPAHDTTDYAAAKFLAGDLSAITVPDGRGPEFAHAAHTKILTRQQLCLSFLGLNARRKPFDDVRVRQAFAMAIDRQPLIHTRGTARIAPNGMLPPGMPGYMPESKLLVHDPARARQLLAAAGHPDGKGLPTIVLTTASRNEQTLRLLREIQRQVGEVGFKTEIASLSWLEFSHRLTGRDLQCFSVSWVADIPDPDSFLYPMYHSQGSANYANYSNAKVDELLIKGRGTSSSLARLDVYREAERLILQDAPLVPLFHPLSVIAIHDVVRGLTVTPMGVGNLAMENVWLDSPQVGPTPVAASAAHDAMQAGTLLPQPAVATPPNRGGVQ